MMLTKKEIRLERKTRFLYTGPHTIRNMGLDPATTIGYTAMAGEVDISGYGYRDINTMICEAEFPRYQWILIPTLTHNERGFRVGRGGGFYDRLLTRHRNLTTVLVTLDKNLTSFQEEEHDMRADIIATEFLWRKV